MSNHIRTLIVDDEAPARQRLRRLLGDHPDVEIIGEAGDGSEALDKIRQLAPDLVFLDIQMPAPSGIELGLSLRPPRPALVFCTADDRYAVEAFQLNAMDYLLKPVNRGRLSRTLERLVRSRAGSNGLEEELVRARAVQERLLTRRLPVLETLRFSGSTRAARGVGGDYYDFLELAEGKFAVAIADVSGKGMHAGLLMAGLQGRLQSLAGEFAADLSGLLEELNRVIWESTDDNKYVTLFYGVYDDRTRRLTYVNAGHHAPLLLTGEEGSGALKRLSQGGTAVGLFESASFEPASVELQTGDVLVLFTDGVVEALGEDGDEYGLQRLGNSVRQHRLLDADCLRSAVLQDLSDFSGSREPSDDVTLVVLKAV